MLPERAVGEINWAGGSGSSGWFFECPISACGEQRAGILKPPASSIEPPEKPTGAHPQFPRTSC